MSESLLSLKMPMLGRGIGQYLMVMILFVIGVQSAVNRINDARFLAGYKNLFVQNLSSYPDTMVYQVAFSQAMPSPSTYYDLVVSINTFSFVDSNTIGWNFTKMNFGLSGFQLKYDAGVNSVIYSLAINYMVVDNSYPDFQIVYFNVLCKMLSQGSNFRSQNITYTSKKFSNDSNYAKMTFLESFNITNTQVDNLILKNNIYQYNMTLVIQYYTWGLMVVNDFQFTLILYNTAYMLDTNERTVLTNTWVLSPGTSATTIHSSLLSDYVRTDRFFSGVSGLNLTRSGNKTFQFRLYVGNVFTFQFSATGITNVDYAGLSVFVMRCPTGFWSSTAGDCVLTCPGTEFVDSSHSLSFCRNCHYSCNGCWDQKNTSCKLCSSLTRSPFRTTTVSGSNWYSCFCSIGYYEAYTTDCVLCSTTLPGCINCANNATCLECQTGMKVFNNVCVCNNPNQILLNGACINRIPGCQTHVNNGTDILCVQCYVQRNFTITNGFRCICQQPIYQRSEDITGAGDFWCNFICGDGYVADGQGCDDNNIMAGDGCSDKCKVQRNFTCSNLPMQASVCLYNLTTQLTFRWAERKLYQNSAVLNFTLEPYCTYWDQVTNWSAIVSTSMPLTKIQHDFFCPNLWSSLRCNLTLTVQYSDHLQDQPFAISLNLANHPKIRFNSRQHYFVPTGNVAEITYQPQQHLSTMYTMDDLFLALTIISLCIMLLSIYFDKIIGLQMIMTIQYMYFLLSGIENNTIEFIPMQRFMKYSTGYNTIYNYTYHSYAPLPNHLNHIYYEKQFLLNMNIMLLILAIAVFIFVVAKLIKMLKDYMRKQREENNTNASRLFQNDPKQESKYFESFYKFYWNNIFFVLVMFLMYQVIYNSIVTVILNDPTWTIFSASLNFISMIFAFFIVIMGILAVGYWYYQVSRKKGRMSLDNSQFIPLQFRLCQKQYVLMYTLVQAVKIWVLALFYDQNYCYYIILPICIIYFVALVIYRPYRRRGDILESLDEEDPQSEDKLCFSIHNFGICFNQFCLIIFIVLCLVWNVNNYTLDSDFPQAILYTCIPILILLNIVAILRMLYKKLGIILMCDYFKDSKENVSFDNDSEKMRKLVRNQNTKVVDEDVYSGNNDDDKQNMTKKQRSKILQDVKKAKQFLIDWKDDAKAVYYNNQYPDSEEDDDGYGDTRRNYRNQSPTNPNRYENGNSFNKYDNATSSPNRYDNGDIINNHQQGLIFTNRAKSNYRNPGVVEMESIPKNLNQSNYQYNKSNEKKVGLLNRSVLESLLDKKQEEVLTNRKVSTSMLNGPAIQEDKRKGAQDLFYLKERLRRELQMKNGIQKTDLQDYVIKD